MHQICTIHMHCTCTAHVQAYTPHAIRSVVVFTAHSTYLVGQRWGCGQDGRGWGTAHKQHMKQAAIRKYTTPCGSESGQGRGMDSGCPNLVRSIDHGHKQEGVDPCLSLVNEVFQSQLLCDLCADLKEGGQQAHELPKPAGVALLVRVLLEGNMASLAVLSDNLTVAKAAGLCERERERGKEGDKMRLKDWKRGKRGYTAAVTQPSCLE